MRLGPRVRPSQPISGWLDVARRVKAINAASDVISGGYRIITFHADGELVIANYPLNVEYLVVGGGGAGGRAQRIGDGLGVGGGGGGAVLSNMGSPITIQPGVLNVKVGAGGAANSNGGISSLDSIAIALGGGVGGSHVSSGVYGAGGDGSSGGGGFSYRTGLGSESLPVGRVLYSQGNVGGTGLTSSSPDYGSGGGGGGAGAVGGNAASSSAGGAGGAGVANSITGSSVTYGGGGGGGGRLTGGAGGTGGGGAGGGNAVGSNGTAQTGGGGGGGGTSTTTVNAGGTGGSGIVIVRFTA